MKIRFALKIPSGPVKFHVEHPRHDGGVWLTWIESLGIPLAMVKCETLHGRREVLFDERQCAHAIIGETDEYRQVALRLQMQLVSLGRKNGLQTPMRACELLHMDRTSERRRSIRGIHGIGAGACI